MTLDIASLETSFDAIAARGDELVEDFYDRLFAAAPAVRPLFPEDMARQRTMLLATLVLLRKSLRNLDAIRPTLRRLGARHVEYGALPEHYPVVAQTLVGSMTHIAGDAWRPEYATAWADALNAIAGEMVAGAEEAEPELRAA
ncbi:MAG TPA: globin domain-containing protein [Thermoleophilaceae bacterium]|nr:globin domain-containing protein [Thermoleophilaceae bacterium]